MHRGYCSAEHNIVYLQNTHLDIYIVRCNCLEIIILVNNFLAEQELEVHSIASEEELALTVYPELYYNLKICH